MNVTRRLRKSVKAISPVLAVLMMIAIAIAGSLITYAWVTGYIGFTTEKAGQAIMVQSVAYNEDDEILLVYVQNVGEGTVELDPTGCIYINGALVTPDDITPDTVIGEKSTATIVVPYTVEDGEKITAKVTTTLGSFTEKSTYPTSTTGGYTPTPQWLYQKTITIDADEVEGSTLLTNFPVLISLSSDGDLAANALDNGDDIKFVLEGETSKLDHEIESFNGATGALTAWVRIPSLSPTVDTTIYMYYGNSEATNQQNPTGVWDTNYQGIWHLSETGTGVADEYTDSTQNNNNGQGGGGNTNGVPSPVTGKIGTAQDFESSGTADYIDVGSGSSLEITGSITIEAWVRPEGYSGIWNMIVARQLGTGSGDAYLLALRNTGYAYIIVDSSSTYRSGISTNNWYHIVGVASGSTKQVYINGVASTGIGATWTLDTNPVLIGAGENGSPGTYPNEQFDGIIDEVRISNTVRSADWIRTEYNNMENPLTFFDIGPQTPVS